jgi:hypothetical protein
MYTIPLSFSSLRLPLGEFVLYPTGRPSIRTLVQLVARLHIPAGILRIPVFSVPVALFPQESGFLFRRNFFFTPSGILSVPGLRM